MTLPVLIPVNRLDQAKGRLAPLLTEAEREELALITAETVAHAAGAAAVILAPSNPFVSIGPILAVPGIREALANTRARRAAISPIIAGQVVKGPAAKMLASLGHEVSALGVARLYRGLIDLFVLDTADAALAPEVEALGMRALVTETLMTTPERKRALAVDVLAALEAAP